MRFALPSKGELEEPTLRFLDACGLRVARLNPRQYTATIAGLSDAVVLFQRAADIGEKVAEGSADVGITGFDTVAESRWEGDDLVVIHEALGYGQCDLVLAVPDAWIDVTSLADLADLSVDFRERGRELRVATKYPRLVQQFFFQKGIHHFHLVASHGAMEVAPAMGYADVIADLTSSGTTLRENRLKTIEAGTILRSQACLIGNRRLLRASREKLGALRQMLELMEAQMRSRGYYTVTANIQGGSADEVAERVMANPEVAGIQGPTIARVYSKTRSAGEWYAITVVVRVEHLGRAVESFRAIGGSSVTVGAPRYVFEAESQTYRRLLEQIG